MRLYLDTNVIMDFLLGRHQPSTDLIMTSVACAHELYISDLTLFELHGQDLGDRISWFLALCSKKLSIVPVTVAHERFAATLATHRTDALHYAVGRSCDALVTRNVRDFPFPRVMKPIDVK